MFALKSVLLSGSIESPFLKKFHLIIKVQLYNKNMKLFTLKKKTINLRKEVLIPNVETPRFS